MTAQSRLTKLTRFGFAARGLLYIVMGTLILKTGRTEDPNGALDYLAEGSGRLLLIAMAAGFVAYGFWRLSDAALNIEGHEPGKKGMRERLGAAGSGIVHLLLAWQAIRLIGGTISTSDGGSQDGAQTALALPGGPMLVALAGIVLMGIAVFQLIKASKCSFLDHLEPRIAGQAWAKWTGLLGYGARGLVFLIAGFFLLQAGLDDQASKARGIEGALTWLVAPWNMLVAFGLIGFGVYCLIEARFRLIHDVPVRAIADRAARVGGG